MVGVELCENKSIDHHDSNRSEVISFIWDQNKLKAKLFLKLFWFQKYNQLFFCSIECRRRNFGDSFLNETKLCLKVCLILVPNKKIIDT